MRLDSERLLRAWRWRYTQSLKAIGRNAFGDLFLTDEHGKVHLLDVGTGELNLIAESVARFEESADTAEKQEDWFWRAEVIAAAEHGLAPGPGQCIGFYPPQIFAECAGLNSAYLIDLYDHVGALGDMHRQIASLPDGAKVRIVVKPPVNS